MLARGPIEHYSCNPTLHITLERIQSAFFMVTRNLHGMHTYVVWYGIPHSTLNALLCIASFVW